MRLTTWGASFLLLVFFPLYDGEVIKALAFQVTISTIPIGENEPWMTFLKQWSLENTSMQDVCHGIHQMRKTLGERFQDFPFLFCAQSPPWSDFTTQTTLKLYFDARNLDFEARNFGCHAHSLQMILNKPKGVPESTPVMVTAPSTPMEIYATVIGLAREPNKENDFLSSDFEVRKELVTKVMKFQPLAVFGVSTEDLFNENYFAMFDHNAVPEDTWETKPDVPFSVADLVKETYYAGEHLFNIRDWCLTHTGLLQKKMPPKSQGGCAPQTLTDVTMIHAQVNVTGLGRRPWEPLTKLSKMFETVQWNIATADGSEVPASHMMIDSVAGDVVHSRLYVTGISDATPRIIVVPNSKYTIVVDSMKVSANPKIPRCSLMRNAYSLKVYVEFLVPFGNQIYPADWIPVKNSPAYINLVEFCKIYFRDDMLREHYLRGSMYMVNIATVESDGSYAVAKGTVHFNTNRLLLRNLDLDPEHLVESFNKKFGDDEFLKLKALYVERNVIDCEAPVPGAEQYNYVEEPEVMEMELMEEDQDTSIVQGGPNPAVDINIGPADTGTVLDQYTELVG